MKDKYPLYIHKKKDGISGKIYYALEHKYNLNGKQITIHVLTLPSFYSIIEWATNEVAENYIQAKIEKRLKVSDKNKCLDKTQPKEENINSKLRLTTLTRIDTNTSEDKPTKEQYEELNKILEQDK